MKNKHDEILKRIEETTRKLYRKKEKLLLLRLRRFFGRPAEVKHKPTATAAEGTTGAGSITAAAPRPPNKKPV